MFSNVLKKFGGKDNKPNDLEERIKTVGQPSAVQPKFGDTDKSVEKPTTNQTSFNVTPKPLEQKTSPNITTSKLSTSTISVSSSTAVEEEVATIFSEGDNNTSISALSNHIKENSGKVEARVWFMLMDLYQIIEERQEFDKTALAFAQLFGTSPPSWFGALPGEKKESLGGGKNMIIFESVFRIGYQEKFKEFLKAARKEKFCRINVSQCKFEQNSIDVLEKILKLFVDLRKAKVASVLMGDNNLISFCQNYIQNKTDKKNLKPEFLENEQLLWLIYLELLQWKGQQEEFENLALEFAEKFEISPPGWEESGVMDLSSLHKDTTDDVETLELDKNLNINNVNPMLDWINDKFDKNLDVDVDFSNIERVDFSAAGAISFHIQELWSNPDNQSRTVTFKYPNELIIVLLEMVGVTEFVSIIPRVRK